MIVWIDAQISPALAPWIGLQYGASASSRRELGLRDATDREIFFAARSSGAIVLTKDSDFARLLELHGAPPQVVWLTLGNTSNERLRSVLSKKWASIVTLLGAGEPLIEIRGDD